MSKTELMAFLVNFRDALQDPDVMEICKDISQKISSAIEDEEDEQMREWDMELRGNYSESDGF